MAMQSICCEIRLREEEGSRLLEAACTEDGKHMKTVVLRQNLLAGRVARRPGSWIAVSAMCLCMHGTEF